MTYRWIAQKSFIERTFTASQADHVLESGTQIIGFDPIQGHVMSWSFASGGGRAVGAWTAHDEGWAVENAGVTRDGLGTTSIDIWTRIGNHAIARSSTARSVDGLSLPDLKESILKRSRK